MKRIILILFIISCIVLSGCLDAPFMNNSNGMLTVNFTLSGEDSRFSTIVPDLNIDRYVIDFTTYNESESDKENIIVNETTSTLTLKAGVWGLILYAENVEGTRLAEIELNDIEIVKGANNEIDAVLEPVSGNGSVSISLDLSAKPAEVSISSVIYTLEKGITSPQLISSEVLSEPYLVDLTCVAGTDYRLRFEILTDTDTIVSEGIVHVYSGVTTTETIMISAADFGDKSINTAPPVNPERLIFIHHSCGSNWLYPSNGNLGNSLGINNYYVRDVSYGWTYFNGIEDIDIGTYTDTIHWKIWFGDPDSLEMQINGEFRRDNIMSSLYVTDSKTIAYDVISDPGGENSIILFKSCYPNSEVGLDINNEKEIYSKILDYFATHQDKLFILITPPGETIVSSYEKTKELCQWLVDEDTGWLSSYPYDNVGVFDFYCVLSEIGSHHTIEDGIIMYEYAADYDGISPYHDGDNHPNSAGNQKSTDEFIPLLNYYYNRWKNN